MVIGQLGWEKIDLIRALKQLVDMLKHARCDVNNNTNKKVKENFKLPCFDCSLVSFIDE